MILKVSFVLYEMYNSIGVYFNEYNLSVYLLVSNHYLKQTILKWSEIMLRGVEMGKKTSALSSQLSLKLLVSAIVLVIGENINPLFTESFRMAHSLNHSHIIQTIN